MTSSLDIGHLEGYLPNSTCTQDTQTNKHAHRYAVKLLYDEVSLGEMESHSELAEQLMEYDTQCFIGSETERGWEESVLNRVPHLFSMSRNKDDVSVRHSLNGLDV